MQKKLAIKAAPEVEECMNELSQVRKKVDELEESLGNCGLLNLRDVDLCYCGEVVNKKVGDDPLDHVEDVPRENPGGVLAAIDVSNVVSKCLLPSDPLI
ncbi:hypothetical protein V6N13_073295 [Hibiscus sabdariffa]